MGPLTSLMMAVLLLTATLGCEPPALVGPTIESHPESQTANAGQAVTLQVTAAGSPALHYQWRRDGDDIPGATLPFYSTPALKPADDGAHFSCKITNEKGSATSTPATITVSDAVAISTHRFKAADGWHLGMTRYLPKSAVTSYEPVLMTHGFIENHSAFDLDNKHSLAMRLAGKGFGVWLLDLRGSGLSSGPEVSDLTGWSFNIDDFIHRDAPAAIDYVLAKTGKAQVFWVGHSMGGIIGLAYIETESKDKIKGIVTLSSACWMGGEEQFDSKPGGFYMAVGVMLGPFLLPDFPFPIGHSWKKGATGKPWEAAIHQFLMSDFGKFTWAPKNMDEATIKLLMDRAVDNTSVNVVRQFLDWTINEDVYTYGPSPYGTTDKSSAHYDEHGFYSYKDHLAEITTPALLIAGEADQVIPPANVKKTYEALSSSDKTLEIIGKSHGYPVDAGHVDLLVGVHSPKQVYPLVTKWLLARASK